MLYPLIFVLGASLPFVSAYPKITTPAAGATLTGGSTITIKWADNGASPSISDLSNYQLFLCAGGDTTGTYDQLSTLVSSSTFSSNSASGDVATGLGGSTTNAYFLKMIATATTGGTITVFSDRFSLSGMTGTFSATVKAALKTVSGTSGPDTINNVVAQNAVEVDVEASYSVAYTLQTGSTRYAPMIPLPPTKITKKTATPQYPTSAYTVATTYMGTPNIATTLTQSGTYSFTSIENTASAASQPTDDMARFLARWRD